MPLLPEAPLKVLLVIARFTYGFQKRSDRIGYGQLAKTTGLERRTVIRAVKFLGNLIHVKPGGPGKGPNEYSLNLDITEAQLLALNQRKNSVGSDSGVTSDRTDTSDFVGKEIVTPVSPFQTNISKPKKSTESDKQIPDSLSHKRSKRKPTAPTPATLAAFEAFYAAYPRHVAKQKAFDAWLKLNADAELISVIMDAVEQYAEEVQNTEPRFILHPATWLNGRRWEDEPVRSAAANANGHPPKIIATEEEGDSYVLEDGTGMSRPHYRRLYG